MSTLGGDGPIPVGLGGGGGSSPTTARGQMIRRGASADEAFSAKTSGNVVAGDGTDAVSVAIATPLAVAPAANLAALGLSEAPLASPSSWTLPSGVTVAANTLTATLTTGGGSARIVGEVTYALRRTGAELVARLTYVGTPSSPTQVWAEVGINDGSRNGFHFQLRGDGQLNAFKMPGFSGPTVSGDPTGTWVRAIVTSASTVGAYYSTAVDRPTSEAGWTYAGEMTGVPTNIGATIHAGIASSAAVNAVATVTGLMLRGWSL